MDDVVYDPFMGRGTTLIEAQLHGCRAYGNDINPLSQVLTKPRLTPPTLSQIEQRLQEIALPRNNATDPDLLVFFERGTLQELYGWRQYFRQKQEDDQLDRTDAWLQMVACNRLTGHSKGFFSVYTLPPNQATSVQAQQKINQKRGQTPEYRDTKQLILKKSKQLLRHSIPDHFWRDDARLFAESADQTTQIRSDSVDLVVTSPPFLDTVNYIQDNWLRMWFCDIEMEASKIWQLKRLEDWIFQMKKVFVELRRILKPQGRIAFEVGEVRGGSVLLENAVVEAASEAELIAESILINTQHFTKTANCWGVSNNSKGTNSNRIVILKKETLT
jgi:methylase of polypeptide subunit release factors